MIKVNSLSGGRTSSYLAVHYPADHDVFSVVCLDDAACAPKDPAIIQYANDKLQRFIPEFGEFVATAEDDRTLRAMIDLEQHIGREITWVRGMSFDAVIDEGTKTRLPSWARRYCTEKMKMLPIFLWWWHNIGEKCEMRIGFRFDEFSRMERFFNNSSPTTFSIPIACKTYGKQKQQFETFNWRYCSFPLIKEGITKDVVDDYWKSAWIGGSLFDERRQIEFPSVSNCIGCFHKKPETLAAMSMIHPEKFRWFIDQEQKGKGTWLDNKVTYQHLMENADEKALEVAYEVKKNIYACDSGGCTE